MQVMKQYIVILRIWKLIISTFNIFVPLRDDSGEQTFVKLFEREGKDKNGFHRVRNVHLF